MCCGFYKRRCTSQFHRRRIHSHQPRASAGMHTEVSAVREDSSILALQRAFCAGVRDREHSRGCELGLNGRTLLTT